MKVTQIIETGLKENGFDGLVSRGTCGRTIGYFSPGNCLSDDFEGGYKHTHSERPDDWIISTIKEPMTDIEIDDCIMEVY